MSSPGANPVCQRSAALDEAHLRALRALIAANGKGRASKILRTSLDMINELADGGRTTRPTRDRIAAALDALTTGAA